MKSELERKRVLRLLPYVLIAVLCVAGFFFRLGAVPLTGLDESLYAESAREMLASGDYVVPRFNGEPFFDKPPLLYWLQAASMRAFGVNSFAARLPSACAGIALVAVTMLLGTMLGNRRTGLAAGASLGCCILCAALARMAIMDALFALTITISLGAFLLAVTKAAPRWLYLVFWAGAGAAMMVKGPAGPVLIALVTLTYIVLRRRWKIFAECMPWLGLPLFALVALPWYFAVNTTTGGTFFNEFFWHQNVARAAGKDFYHNQPFFFYIPVFALGFFPWSVFLIPAWKTAVRLAPTVSNPAVQSTGRRANDGVHEEAALFLAVWISVVLVVFSVIVSKLPGYIFPLFPAAAVLSASAWADEGRVGSRTLAKCAWVALAVSVVFAAALLFAEMKLPQPIPGLRPILAVMGAVLVLGTAASIPLVIRGSRSAGLAALAGGVGAFLLVTVTVALPVASRTIADDSARIGKAIHRLARPGDTAVTYKIARRIPSVPFYAQRIVKNLHTAADLRRLLDSGRPVLVVTPTDNQESAISSGQLVHKFGEFKVVRLRETSP